MSKKFNSQLKIALTALFLLLPTSVKALEVEITPTNPQLGDTISVLIATDNPDQIPKVSLNQQNYPVFLLNNGYRALLPTSPLDQSGKLTIQVTGDGESKNLAVWLGDRTFPVQRITLSGKADRPATELELKRVAELKQLVTPTKYWLGSFLRPNNNQISTVYGVRRYYNGVFAQDYYHKRCRRYAGGYGSPVVAPAAGKITLVGKEAAGFHVHGNVVGIDHGQGVVSLFMHLQDINVKEGDMVQPGQLIGTVGATGASTGPHLHWGLYVNEVSVDPVPWRFNAIE
ncbi:MAG: M23 family metallopeptidase [Hydrococcus sp. SU_1_0]|nr:M23 family metallopeptidase [Hydrococcus sp. SU_1_0]